MNRDLDYAKAIRILRAERNMSREELARKAGISYSYLSEIEKGIKRPSSDILSKIASAFDIRPSAFMMKIELVSASQPMESRWADLDNQMPISMLRESGAVYDPLSTLVDIASRLSEDDQELLLEIAKRLVNLSPK